MRHCNTKTSQHAKLGYIFLALIASLMCLLALIYGPYMSSELDFIGFFECDADDMKCIGISIVYRISFALGLLFLVSALLSLLSEPIFHTYDHGCWTLKFLLFTSILILSFWVPNSVFNWYIVFSIISGIIYLLSQTIILIDFAYHWNECWVDNYDSSQNWKFWLFLMFFFPALCWILIAAMSISSYIYFECEIAILLTSISLLSGILLTAISSSSLIEHGSLLTSSYVSLLFNYLTFSALASNPDMTCNLWESREHNFLLVITDVFVSTITLVYFAMKLENNGKYHEVKTHESLELKSMNKAEIPPEEDMQEVVAVKKQESSVYFHLLMMVFGFNLAMIMTNWGLVTGWTSYTSFGIRITQATMTLILFFWSVLAPYLCPDRDFSL